MRAATAITEILRSIVNAMARRDDEQQRFEARLLIDLGDIKRSCEANGEMLKELIEHAGTQDKKIREIREDLEQHQKDRTKHAIGLGAN